MSEGVTIQWLESGSRLHLQHGPIDLIVLAEGNDAAVKAAYQRAIDAFRSVLTELVSELADLRAPLRFHSQSPSGVVARRMYAACMPLVENTWLTPMIAVAGSVADHILSAMLAGSPLTKAYVNNGGDIALFLDGSECFTVGICENPTIGRVASTVQLHACDGVGGVATSGWRGRSHSLGIADAVTVLAHSAASADTAASLIANAVDVPASSNIERLPANELLPDSDLRDRPVTINVGKLNKAEVQSALHCGQQAADKLLSQGLIKAAFISLKGDSVISGERFDNQLSTKEQLPLAGYG